MFFEDVEDGGCGDGVRPIVESECDAGGFILCGFKNEVGEELTARVK